MRNCLKKRGRCIGDIQPLFKILMQLTHLKIAGMLYWWFIKKSFKL